MIPIQITASESICASGFNTAETFDQALMGISSVNESGHNKLKPELWTQLKSGTPIELTKSAATILSYHTLNRLKKSLNWTPEQIRNSGLILATTTSEIDVWEQTLPYFQVNETDTKAFRHQSLGILIEDLKKYFQLNGPSTVIATSCSAAIQALALGCLWIQSGMVDRCIVGTSEILSELTALGFDSLRLVTKNPCRPFDRNLNGINLGEGSAFLALTKKDLDAPALAYIKGFGLASDAYHATSPHPQGEGAQRAIQQALQMAQLTAKDIDWFYSHGTGSEANDEAESKAIKNIFGNQTFVSSSKSIHGHTLAASGLLESVLAVEAIKRQQVIKNISTSSEFEINLHHTPQRHIQNILKNSLGFGGINASLIISAPEVQI